MDKQKTVAFFTLGCKLNFSETSAIAAQFELAGYKRAKSNEKADIYVVNTCTVTELANKKSKQAIKKMIKTNPLAKVVVIGCYSQLKPGDVAAIHGVDLVLGSENKFKILEYLDNPKLETKVIIPDNKQNTVFTPSYSFGDRTRSFLKVQDGCDYYCSYCTIPNARGRSRNNTINKTVEIANQVVGKGVKEIILTGVNIGDFGKSTNEKFIDLLKALDNIEGLKRLRISSIEPNLLTEEIIKFVAESKTILPHFHIPLQCGTDHLLRLMRRRYSTQLYQSRVNFIKSLMPDACIAADVIVGVPGETDSEFEKALTFIRHVGVSELHVFTYSERENTRAVAMENQVSINTRKKRSKVMHDLAEILRLKFYKEHLGSVRQVLFEGQKVNNAMQGFTDNYIRVEVPYNADLINTIQTVKLTKILKNGNVLGERV